MDRQLVDAFFDELEQIKEAAGLFQAAGKAVKKGVSKLKKGLAQRAAEAARVRKNNMRVWGAGTGYMM